MSRTFKILSPTAILGYGFPEESFMKAMEESPDLIAVDAGLLTRVLTTSVPVKLLPTVPG